MRYIIDYRNGAGGNTILGHLLVACGKVNKSFDMLEDTNDFGPANMHMVYKYNNTNLRAKHVNENDIQYQYSVIIEIKTQNWSELLRTKFAYGKSFQDYPRLDNYKKFLNLDFDSTFDAWTVFYKGFRAPSWPDCKRYEDIVYLPKYMQQEINAEYQAPIREVNKDNFIELLQRSYSDQLKYCQETHNIPLNDNSLVYDIGDYYFNKNFDKLKEVAELLEWTWNDTVSNNFHSWVLDQNKTYLNGLDQMKEQCYNNTNKFTMDWEIAYLNAIKEHIGEHSGKTI